MRRDGCSAESRVCVVIDRLPALLSSEALVEQSQHLWHVELDVFKVQVILVVLLHLKQVIQLEVQFEQTPVAAYTWISMLLSSELPRNLPL